MSEAGARTSRPRPAPGHHVVSGRAFDISPAGSQSHVCPFMVVWPGAGLSV